jgi:coenzyme F420 hydrogenase subunit beta
LKIRNVQDVAARRLCLGCGACFGICPEGKVRLVDVEDEGIRPFVVEEGGCRSCGTCLAACPGIRTTAPDAPPPQGKEEAAFTRWGGFTEVWEGFAAEPGVRFEGSSGGLCTALSLFCLEQGVAGGVLHVGADRQTPWKNRTVRSTTREGVLAGAGSRYAPASPCEGFGEIERAGDASVFVGKPCDVAGLRMAQQIRPELAGKTRLAIGFFCAGTPSTRGTLELFKMHGVDPGDVSAFRYRGQGWPGMATARFKDGTRPPLKVSYKDSWGFVQKFRPFRCYLCPDLTAESADISVGDPWYREVGVDEPGRSLILVRTEAGREIFRRAREQGYVTAEPRDPEIIYRSQKNLLGKRRAIWGRLLALRLLGVPRPELKGFHLYANWRELPFGEKARSVFGTARRAAQRNYFKPVRYENQDGAWRTVQGAGKHEGV